MVCLSDLATLLYALAPGDYTGAALGFHFRDYGMGDRRGDTGGNCAIMKRLRLRVQAI